MSVKHSLLAVLADGDRYGYQLRAEFEERTGATWPLNIGQVYTTLSRLERDGLVEPAGQDGANHVFYRITGAGRDELFAWFARPVTRAERPRDELAVKLALAVTVDGVDVPGIVHAQRKHALAALQDYTRVKARLDVGELAASLVLESMIFQCEAEIRWLDHVEARVLRHAREGRGRSHGVDNGVDNGTDNGASTSAATRTGNSSTTHETAAPVVATTEGKSI
ncbi:transcriptional regulator, PadR-like family [Catenulispora acidiphila DSM 44928]|uniref:Transcriptional regulator, PadR-like family n=1 Tax=Catenulispora acidiphila (strain DSM 44928 / JCM 14897 / NBRC 102108 / NRRL B-24433 / ID139908) TaxID=479433 RepID=C7QHX9_CATAD|nr:PadR family transcriptional regulator [Catenulispora acidiphila]ACU73024.1 transcriptional regulator, PadR-like family [Catenulispora acidiphila DSM 44928]